MGGLRRHMKFVTLFQGKYFLYMLFFGLVIGIVRAFIADSTGSPHGAINDINIIMTTVLMLMPGNLTMRYLQYQADLSLQMGCTRKNIYLGTFIIILELAAESFICYLLLGTVNDYFAANSADVYTGFADSYMNIFVYLISILVMINMGLINALMARRFGTKSIYLTMIIFYVIFIAAVMDEDVISWITGPYAAPIIIFSMLILLVILLAVPVRNSVKHIVIRA